jgi:UDP-N-acetylglucosamine 2-epimerase (non-hydrolysing)
MAPVILELESRGWSPHLILTGQHKETMDRLILDFRIRTPPLSIYVGPEITSIQRVIPWFLRCLWRLWRDAKRIFPKNGEKGVVLVHGDTFSTLLGALVGRFTGQQVAHVESGLRSFNLWHPFPEELTRLAVFRLSHLAFCPDDWARSNLERYPISAVSTDGNTLLDALRIALATEKPLPLNLPVTPFGVVSLHRFENIFKRDRLISILDLIEEAADRYPLAFVLHPATRRNLEKFGLLERLSNNKQIHLWPRMGYFEFVGLLKKTMFVITDGGSNQEELSYLGKPTLLMRQATERQEGLGTNVVLGAYERSKMLDFINGLASASVSEVSLPDQYPTIRIVDLLSEYVPTSHKY